MSANQPAGKLACRRRCRRRRWRHRCRSFLLTLKASPLDLSVQRLGANSLPEVWRRGQAVPAAALVRQTLVCMRPCAYQLRPGRQLAAVGRSARMAVPHQCRAAFTAQGLATSDGECEQPAAAPDLSGLGGAAAELACAAPSFNGTQLAHPARACSHNCLRCAVQHVATHARMDATHATGVPPAGSAQQKGRWVLCPPPAGAGTEGDSQAWAERYAAWGSCAGFSGPGEYFNLTLDAFDTYDPNVRGAQLPCTHPHHTTMGRVLLNGQLLCLARALGARRCSGAACPSWNARSPDLLLRSTSLERH